MHCKSFLTCGIMEKDGLQARDSGVYFRSTDGSTHGPRECLVTIAGRLITDRPGDKVRILIEEATISECADTGATITMKSLDVSSSVATVSSNNRYMIRGLTRNWCTTTYRLHIVVNEKRRFRHEIQLQGIESIQKKEKWQHNYDIVLTQ